MRIKAEIYDVSLENLVDMALNFDRLFTAVYGEDVRIQFVYEQQTDQGEPRAILFLPYDPEKTKEIREAVAMSQRLTPTEIKEEPEAKDRPVARMMIEAPDFVWVTEVVDIITTLLLTDEFLAGQLIEEQILVTVTKKKYWKIDITLAAELDTTEDARDILAIAIQSECETMIGEDVPVRVEDANEYIPDDNQ